MDIKKFRTDIIANQGSAPFTQKAFGEALGVTQEQVSRWEKNPGSISVNIIYQICDTFGVSPSLLFKNYKRILPEPFNLGTPFSEHKLKLQMLEYYSDKQLSTLGSVEKVSPVAQMVLSEFRQLKKPLSAKPLVAFVGSFDSGKSHMINTLCGKDILPTRWSPTTSIYMYLKHTESRPNWLKENVLVLNKPTKPIDFRRFNPTSEDEVHKTLICSGSFDLLEGYGSYPDGDISNTDHRQGAHIAVIYVDAPVLLACDLMEIPNVSKNNAQPNEPEAVEIIDCLVYLSQARSFMDNADLIFLKGSIDLITTICARHNYSDPLSKLLVIASQAHLLKDSDEINATISTGAKQLWDHLSDIEHRNLLTEEQLLSRFTPSNPNSSEYRSKFEDLFTNMLLVNKIPEMIREMDELVENFKYLANNNLDEEIQRFERIDSERGSASSYYSKLTSDWPTAVAAIATARKDLQTIGRQCGEAVVETFKSWWTTSLNVDGISELIRSQKYSPREAQSLIGDSLSQLFYSQLDAIQMDMHEKWAEQFTLYLQVLNAGYSQIHPTPNKPKQAMPATPNFLERAFISTGALQLIPFWGTGLMKMDWQHVEFQEVITYSQIEDPGFLRKLSNVFLPTKILAGPTWHDKLAEFINQYLESEKVKDQYVDVITRWWDTINNDIELLEHEVLKEFEDSLNKYKTATTEFDQVQLRETISDLAKTRGIINNIVW